MAESLDLRIRRNNIPNMDLSLDEIIYMNKIGKSTDTNSNGSPMQNGPSKFDRYRHQDDDDNEMDEDDVPQQMPKLVPFVANTLPPKNNSKPIHERLGARGDRGSVCESIHTSRLKLFTPNFKAKKRASVQNRLGKHWINPATAERNRITLHALNSFANAPTYNMLTTAQDDPGRKLLNAFAKAIEREAAPKPIEAAKYDMKIQKEISSLQGKELYYACPGAFVISSDGPGVRGQFKVPTHATDMSMNQRFA